MSGHSRWFTSNYTSENRIAQRVNMPSKGGDRSASSDTTFRGTLPTDESSESPLVEAIHRLQTARNSYVICIIHHHTWFDESRKTRHDPDEIGENHLEDFLTAIARAPRNLPLDVVLHSVGGNLFAVKQIARAIRSHPKMTTLFVPYYAKGLSTLLALAGDKLVMGSNAVLSPIEATDQLLSEVLKRKGVRRSSDQTLLNLHMARNECREIRQFICEVVHNGSHGEHCDLSNNIVGERFLPWDPITVSRAKGLGIQVSTTMPREIFELIRACRADPVADQGVKTVDHLLVTRESRIMPAVSPSRRLQNSDRTFFDGDWDDVGSRDQPTGEAGVRSDLCGVFLENCNLAVRPFIEAMERQRGSRVLCIVHRSSMESSEIDGATAEDVLSALETLDEHVPLDIVLHTPGGYHAVWHVDVAQ